MYGNNESMEARSERRKSRAIVLRCTDEEFLNLIQLIRSQQDIYIVFTKSSINRLAVIEEAF